MLLGSYRGADGRCLSRAVNSRQ